MKETILKTLIDKESLVDSQACAFCDRIVGKSIKIYTYSPEHKETPLICLDCLKKHFPSS